MSRQDDFLISVVDIYNKFFYLFYKSKANVKDFFILLLQFMLKWRRILEETLLSRKQSYLPHSLFLRDERGGEVLLWLECTQGNAMDGHSRVNSAHGAPGGEFCS